MRHNHTSLNGAVFAVRHVNRPLILSDQSYTSALRKDVHPLASCTPPSSPPSTLSYLSLVSQCPIRATQVLCLPQINRKLMHFSASTQITVALSRLCLTRGVCVCVFYLQSSRFSRPLLPNTLTHLAIVSTDGWGIDAAWRSAVPRSASRRAKGRLCFIHV